MRLKRMLLAVILTLAIIAFSPSVEARDVDQILGSMTLEEKVSQLLFPAFRTENGLPVTEITRQVAETLRQYPVGGVILFRENLVTAEQTRQLIQDLQSTASNKLPLFIGIDQEGGRVTRLPYGTVMPGNMALGATGNPDNAYQAAQSVGDELAELGFNLNFAPVLDINSNPDNPVIGVRSFGEDPDVVASMGQSFIRGLHDAGIAAAVKHFPGHGDTSVDSHLGLPTLPVDQPSLERRELKPFMQVLTVSPDMIMTAHIALPKLDPQTAQSVKTTSRVHLPATLSRTILTGLLREHLGYNGVIITDALNMQAIVKHFGPGDAAVRAIQAGADLLLMPDLQPSYDALLAAVRSGDISEQRLDQSVRRILTVKIQRGFLSPASLSKQPQTKQQRLALAARLAAQAVTLLKNDGQVLPFSLWPKRKLLLLAPAGQAAAMRQAAEQLFVTAGLSANDVMALEYQGTVSPAHVAALTAADQIILATDSPAVVNRDPHVSPVATTAAALTGLAAKTGKPFAVIALRNPYDISYLQGAPALLAVYAPVKPNITAGIKAIYGQSPIRGKLPVTIVDQSGKLLYPRGYGLSLSVREENDI